jgi:photosystem II stability/assembly factor-like uncharacterized protein
VPGPAAARIVPWLAAAALALTFTACGGDESTGEADSALVDPDKQPPINSLTLLPEGDGLLLTTNRGLFRVTEGGAEPIGAEAETPDGTTPVGTFMAVAASGDGELIGSGHPDRKGKIAPFLGLLRSADGGRSWEVVSRYGLTDLHVMRPAGERLYALDAVLPALLVSDDGGRQFEELSLPSNQILDLVVDPADPDHLLASDDREIFRSTDAGESWSQVSAASSARLAWPAGELAYRADEDGLVYSSAGGESTWQLAGSIEGEPWKLEAASGDELYAALADGTVVVSNDGGESWRDYFAP